MVIDEVQRAADLLLAIKQSVDEDQLPGRFLLTGSANLLTIKTVHDPLAGRVAFIWQVCPVVLRTLYRATNRSSTREALVSGVDGD